MTRMLPFLAVAGLALAAYSPAQAQLGSVNNPPPQHLFDTGPSQRLNNGLGTMAARRAEMAKAKRTHRTIRR